MKSVLTLCLIVTLLSCTSGKSGKIDNPITISGKIENAGVGEVVLEHFNGRSLDIVDTLKVNSDGTYFTDYQPEEPGYFRINYYQTQFVNILFTGEPIEVNVDGSSPTAFFEIRNSEEMDYLNDLNSMMEEFRTKRSELDQAFRDASREGDEAEMAKIRDEFAELQINTNESIKGKIRNMGASLALLQAVNYLDRDREFDFIDSVAQVIDQEIPDYRIKKEFMAEIEKLRRLAIGSQAPEIALPNPDGEIIKLSSLQGSYVLVDFWAAWCRPCRMENPNNVRLYNQYKNQGFEIYGVSLDREKDAWLKAIADDGLTWPQVSDLKYFQSEAAQEYNVNAIPATILLDKEGKIIAKNLRGKALEDKLAEIF